MNHIINYKNARRSAFTLIELMVVVAVIAILATLGVSNFSAAIKRTRNAGRQADIQAVAKSLETCYDVPSGVYKTIPTSGTNVEVTSSKTSLGKEGFTAGASDNSCLNESIQPTVVNYDYTLRYNGTPPQAWVVCAKLEQVANWGSIGNTNKLPGSPTDTFTPCDEGTAGTGECFYCVRNQQ